MSTVAYNRFNAFVYQLTEFVERFKPGFINQVWVKKTRDYCRPDWAEWRTQLVMENIDDQVEEIHDEWKLAEEERNKPIFREKPSDGSAAQELLGGEMRLSSPWLSEHEPSS